MIVIRLITESDRVVFLILWVIGMFAASIYLISVEYFDDSIQKTLEEVSEREADFGELMPDSEQVHEIVHARIRERHEELYAHYIEHWRESEQESSPENEQASLPETVSDTAPESEDEQ